MSKVQHLINLFLEIFGECYILTDTLIPEITIPIRRLQWDFLPPGSCPWAHLNDVLDSVVDCVRRNRSVIKRRFQLIHGFGPDAIAIGRAGFKGYVAFSFTERNIHILESVFSDNATYVFENNWEELTRLSKGQILLENRHLNRVIHCNDWENQIGIILRRT